MTSASPRTFERSAVIALVAEQVRSARSVNASDGPRFAVMLANAGRSLLTAKAFAEAEPLLRECLAIREKQGTDDWEAHHAR